MPRNSKQVKITHPGGLESEVDERAVPHWESAGWTRGDAAPPDVPAADLKKPTPPARRENKEG